MTISLIWRVVAVLAALAAVLGIVAYGVHQIEAAGAAKATAAQAKQFQEDVATARAREQAIAFKQQEAADVADKYHALAEAGATRIPGSTDRLLHALSATDAGCVSRDPAASAPGPAASSAADLRADLRRRLAEAAGQLVRFADRSHGAGLDAEGQYDALGASAPAH